MDCVYCNNTNIVYKSVIRDSKWRSASLRLINDKLKSSLSSVSQLDVYEWNKIMSTYTLGVINFRDKYELVLNEALSIISDRTRLSKSTIGNIIVNEAPSNLSEFLFDPINVDDLLVQSNTIVISDDITIDNTFKRTIFEDELLYLMRYKVLDGLFNTDILSNFNDVIVVNGTTPNKNNFSLFEEDIPLTRGIISVEKLNDIDNEVVLCGILPNSKLYVEFILKVIGSRKFFGVSTNTLKYNFIKDLHFSTVTCHGLFIVYKGVDPTYICETILRTIPPFPYSREFISSFEDMYEKLVHLSNNLPIQWSISRNDCNYGIVERSYEKYYDTVDSIENHFTEEERIKCVDNKGKNSKSPYDVSG